MCRYCGRNHFDICPRNPEYADGPEDDFTVPAGSKLSEDEE